MIVISDSSPLIALAAIGRLNVLRVLFDQVVIPETVFDEVSKAGEGRTGAEEITEADWIKVLPVSNHSLLRVLQARLDPGEASAIALAIEQDANLVLLDERRGRREAIDLGLRVTGVVGVVVRAKQAGLTVSVQTVLDDLRTRGGFWMSDSLYNYALRLAGE